MSKAKHRQPFTFLRAYPPPETNGIAKHIALRQALISAINDGFWKSGAKLPTETELVRSTPYSLGTVQRALRALVEEGYVERRRGYGTYVTDRRKQLQDPWHCRFLSDDGKTFLPVFPVPLKRSTTDRHGSWSAPLRQDRHTVIQIDRRMEINDEFTVYSKFFVLAETAPELRSAPLATLLGANLKQLIARALGRPLTALKEQLRQIVLPDEICAVIDVEPSSLGLLIEAVAYAGADTPAYYQELYVPPTERRLFLESKVPA